MNYVKVIDDEQFRRDVCEMCGNYIEDSVEMLLKFDVKIGQVWLTS